MVSARLRQSVVPLRGRQLHRRARPSRPTSTISATSTLRVNAADKIEQTLRELAPEADIHFKRVAVRPEQIEDWHLPTRPTKTTDSRTKRWTGGESVELDAIEANQLRQLCDFNISMHIDRDRLAKMEVAERSERELLTSWRSVLAEGAGAMSPPAGFLDARPRLRRPRLARLPAPAGREGPAHPEGGRRQRRARRHHGPGPDTGVVDASTRPPTSASPAASPSGRWTSTTRAGRTSTGRRLAGRRRHPARPAAPLRHAAADRPPVHRRLGWQLLLQARPAHQERREGAARPRYPRGRRLRRGAAVACIPSGRHYRWIAGPDEAELAAAPAWLVRLLEPVELPQPVAPARRPIRGGNLDRYAEAALERRVRAHQRRAARRAVRRARPRKPTASAAWSPAASSRAT